jgi:hypothetical protein
MGLIGNSTPGSSIFNLRLVKRTVPDIEHWLHEGGEQSVCELVMTFPLHNGLPLQPIW